MEIIGNSLNGRYFAEILRLADSESLELIRAAVAYTNKPDPLIDLARARAVPLRLYTLLDGDRFPPLRVLDRFVNKTKPSIQLFVTRNYFHPKIYWFEGVGVYIGSANLTDSGWNNNLECGVWFDADDIERQRLAVELEAMFAVIADRCVAASPKHLEMVKALELDRRDFRRERTKFETLVARALEPLPGQDSPIDPTKSGTAMRRFVDNWEAALTDLLKLVKLARERPSPEWVSREAHPAFIQDQATEYWYHRNVRSVGQEQIEILHHKNRTRIDAALDEVFRDWAELDDAPTWAHWVNEAPQLVGERLSQDRLRNLSADDVHVIVRNSHALRETARHIRKARLKLPQNLECSMDERYSRFAGLLSEHRNDARRDLGEVLEYVVWGDAETKSCAERIWNALHDPKRQFPYIGEHTLGELVGYARPDEFPPRNNRVRKSLRAVGFEH